MVKFKHCQIGTTIDVVVDIDAQLWKWFAVVVCGKICGKIILLKIQNRCNF